jgi:peptide deformylase
MDEIRIYPDPILMKKAAKVQNIDGQVKGIVDRMTEAMHFHRGIGLAAPQIGILSQIIIVGPEESGRAFINPELVEGDGDSILEEGCLSLPAIEVPVKRKERVFLRAWDLDGREINWEVSGFPGRVFQHEIDHLHGILIIDHISRLKRKLLTRKMIKDLKRSQRKGSIS